jgi:hypothetical protein
MMETVFVDDCGVRYVRKGGKCFAVGGGIYRLKDGSLK